MRRRLLPLVGVTAALIAGATGCASVYSSSQGSLDGLAYKGADGVSAEHVYIKTTGYYFFWTVPLASGDLRWNDETKSINGGTRLFNDMVGATELQDAMFKIAETRNCDVVDVSFFDSDTSFAGISTGGLIGAMFGSSQMGISGVLVPRKEKATVREEGAK